MSDKYKNYSLQPLISNSIIPIGSIASCFDCTAKITSNGNLLDEIDLQEYSDPSAWATYVARSVKNSRLPRQNGWKIIKISGKTLEELYSSFLLTTVNYSVNTNEKTCKFSAMADTDSVSSTFNLESQFIIATSCLSTDQIKFLEIHSNKTLQYTLDLSTSPELTTATYLIVDPDSEKKCRRTLKYLFASIKRIPVLSFQCNVNDILI